MKMKAWVALVAPLFLAGALSATACKSKKKKDGPSVRSDHKVNTKVLSYFPKNTELVVGVNKSVRSGKLFGQVKGFLKKRLGSRVEVLTLCDIDIVEKSESVVGGGRMGFKDILVVVKGFKKADLAKCADVAKGKGKTATVKQEGQFTAVVTGDTTHWVGWVDDNTFIAGPDFDKDRLAKRLKGEDGLDKDPRTVSLLKKVDNTADIWWGGVSPEGKPWKSPVGSFLNTRGAVGIATGIKIDAAVGVSKPDIAKALSGMAQGQLSAPPDRLKPIVKKIKISHKDADVLLFVDLSDADIKETVAAVDEDEMLQKVVGMIKKGLEL